MTGKSLNGSGNYDYVTIGYSPSGITLAGWPQRWDGPSQLDDIPVQVLLQGSTVVVTGNANDSGYVVGDIATIVYDYSGNILAGCPQIYNGPANGWDGVGRTYAAVTYQPMAIDASWNVYVGGWSQDTAGDYDMITFKYNAAGIVQSGWPQIYHTTGKDDITRGLALDASNDVCITGWTTPHNTYNGDYITIEYDNSGNMMAGWPVTYNGTANGDDQAMAIVAAGENIWITGYSNGTGTLEDFLTIKYSNSNPSVLVKNISAVNNTVGIYPNPSSGRFTLCNAIAGSQLIITNVLGEIIYESKINSPQAQIDLSKEAKGIYFYRIISESSFITEGKLITQ